MVAVLSGIVVQARKTSRCNITLLVTIQNIPALQFSSSLILYDMILREQLTIQLPWIRLSLSIERLNFIGTIYKTIVLMNFLQKEFFLPGLLIQFLGT